MEMISSMLSCVASAFENAQVRAFNPVRYPSRLKEHTEKVHTLPEDMHDWIVCKDVADDPKHKANARKHKRRRRTPSEEEPEPGEEHDLCAEDKADSLARDSPEEHDLFKLCPSGQLCASVFPPHPSTQSQVPS